VFRGVILASIRVGLCLELDHGVFSFLDQRSADMML
jgi:hypothetical protein